MSKHASLVIVRHGQSEWNALNKFTGWVDVDLAPKGISEAKAAGNLLNGRKFDEAFTSALMRAQKTLRYILEGANQTDIKVSKDERLNERMYGELQGMDKDEARKEFGENQVHIWRRSFDTPPPGGESLKGTADRVIPYYISDIEPLLKAGKDLIIAAHGNSLRALIMHLENLSREEILKIEVPTGKPRIYEFDADLKVIRSEYL
jgi:2,3-bisphosphoglycerate-dependent phosphoglycerate mutase